MPGSRAGRLTPAGIVMLPPGHQNASPPRGFIPRSSVLSGLALPERHMPDRMIVIARTHDRLGRVMHNCVNLATLLGLSR